jgi:hypothetical protein
MMAFMGQELAHLPQSVQSSDTPRRIRGFLEKKAMRAPEGQRLRHQKRGETMAETKSAPKKAKIKS